jgi:hypothetical protein
VLLNQYETNTNIFPQYSRKRSIVNRLQLPPQLVSHLLIDAHLHSDTMTILPLHKPVGDRDREVLGMGSFGDNAQLYGRPPVTRAKH